MLRMLIELIDATGLVVAIIIFHAGGLLLFSAGCGVHASHAAAAAIAIVLVHVNGDTAAPSAVGSLIVYQTLFYSCYAYASFPFALVDRAPCKQVERILHVYPSRGSHHLLDLRTRQPLVRPTVGCVRGIKCIPFFRYPSPIPLLTFFFAWHNMPPYFFTIHTINRAEH